MLSRREFIHPPTSKVRAHAGKNPLFANKATTSAFLRMKMCFHAVWSQPHFATRPQWRRTGLGSWAAAAQLPACPRVWPRPTCGLLRPLLAVPTCPAHPSEDDIHYKNLLLGLVLTVASLDESPAVFTATGMPQHRMSTG